MATPTNLAQYGVPEFLALVEQDPSGLGAEWTHIVAHIQTDANSGLIPPNDVIKHVQGASLAFLNSLQQFASAVASGDTDKAVEASANLVSTNFTSSGASQVIDGLIQAGIGAGAQAATPLAQDAVKQMTGSFLSQALGTVAGGLAASGVGAAVGAGISLLSGVFSGLFGSPPEPQYHVGSCGLQDKPDIVVGYTWMYGDKRIGSPIVEGGPGNPNWRKFPNEKADKQWFA